MLILPAIDVIEGRCVRLTHGDYARETDYGLDPVDVAKGFEFQGAEWLHLIDLDGARTGSPMNLRVVERIATETSLRVEFGGGIRDQQALEAAFDVGVTRVVLGTVLVRDPDWAAALFADRGGSIVAGIDAKGGQVAVHGWQDASSVDGLELARSLVKQGCQRIITTDIATDGAFTGPNLEWLGAMVAATGVSVIASGGISSLDDLLRIYQALPQIEGIIVGKALYEGRFDVRDAIETVQRPVSHR